MKNWTEESWQKDYPRRNSQALEAIDAVLDSLGGFICNNAGNHLDWMRMFASDDRPDNEWIIRLHDVACELFPDGVLLSCQLVAHTKDSQKLIKAAKTMLQMNKVFEALQAEELESESLSVFHWQMEVEYDSLSDVVEKIVEGLRSANPPFRLQRALEESQAHHF